MNNYSPRHALRAAGSSDKLQRRVAECPGDYESLAIFSFFGRVGGCMWLVQPLFISHAVENLKLSTCAVTFSKTSFVWNEEKQNKTTQEDFHADYRFMPMRGWAAAESGEMSSGRRKKHTPKIPKLLDMHKKRLHLYRAHIGRRAIK